MSEPKRPPLEELIEKSKDDREILVGSDLRGVAGYSLHLEAELTRLQVALAERDAEVAGLRQQALEAVKRRLEE